MASFSDIEVKRELRPCLVNGKPALFHIWVHFNDYINGNVISRPAGLVEIENGHMINVYPTSIRFTDNKLQEYCFEMPAGSSPEEIAIALHDLKFIQKGYENLVENDKDIEVRAVGKDIDCLVECKTEADLYRHYVESLGVAIEALEKQCRQQP